MEVGVDTSALYYFLTSPDGLPEADRRTSRKMSELIQHHSKNSGLAIPAVVVLELTNILHHRYGQKASIEAAEALLSDERNRIVETGGRHCNEALLLSKRTGVKYTDCMIALSLMDAGINTIITADKEFNRIPGIKLL